MPMDAGEIERLIRARIPDAHVTIRDLAGDGDHYAATVIADARAAGVSLRRLGRTGGDALTLAGERPILVAKLTESFEGWLPAYMAGAVR